MRRIFAKVILLISQNTVGINAKSGSNSKRLTKALFGENQKYLKIWTGIMLSIATMVQPVLLSSVPPSLLPLPFSPSESSECSKSSRQETIYSEMPSRLEWTKSQYEGGFMDSQAPQTFRSLQVALLLPFPSNCIYVKFSFFLVDVSELAEASPFLILRPISQIKLSHSRTIPNFKHNQSTYPSVRTDDRSDCYNFQAKSVKEIIITRDI